MDLREDRYDNLNNTSLPVVFFDLDVISFESDEVASRFGPDDTEAAFKVGKHHELAFEPMRSPILPVGSEVVFDAADACALYLVIHKWSIHLFPGWEGSTSEYGADESLMVSCKLIPSDDSWLIKGFDGEMWFKMTHKDAAYWNKYYCTPTRTSHNDADAGSSS